MKKIILIVVLCVALSLLSACGKLSPAQNPDNPRQEKGVITLGPNGLYEINVSRYTRSRDGWIIITAADGRVFKIHERNVLIIEE